MNVTNINPRNLDEWLFEHLEGTLSPAENAMLQDYLAAHPELQTEAEIWESSIVREPEMAWPGETAFLESRGLNKSIWSYWKVGLNVLLVGVAVGTILYFGFKDGGDMQKTAETTLHAEPGTKPDLVQMMDDELNRAIPTGDEDGVVWNVGLPKEQRLTNYIQKKNNEFSLADVNTANKASHVQANPSLHNEMRPIQEEAKKPVQEEPGGSENNLTQLSKVASGVSGQDIQTQKSPLNAEIEGDENARGNGTPPFILDRPGIPKEKGSEPAPETRKEKKEKRSPRGNWHYVPIFSDPF